jgi:hypothetical protein
MTIENQNASARRKLADHILEIIPNNPQILSFKDVWDLFSVEDYKGDELGIQPTMAIAILALNTARQEYSGK